MIVQSDPEGRFRNVIGAVEHVFRQSQSILLIVIEEIAVVETVHGLHLLIRPTRLAGQVLVPLDGRLAAIQLAGLQNDELLQLLTQPALPVHFQVKFRDGLQIVRAVGQCFQVVGGRFPTPARQLSRPP